MKRTYLSSFMTGMVTMLLLVCITGSALATSGKVTKELEDRNIRWRKAGSPGCQGQCRGTLHV